MSSFRQQFRTIFRKNLLINFRSKGTLKELINLLVMFAVILALKKSSTNTQYIPVYMSIAILLFCRGVALNWIGEKQTKQAEVQRIMGVSNPAYFSGWFSFFLLNGVFLSVIFIGLLAIGGVFDDSSAIDFGQAIGLYTLYMLASFSFTLMLSSFFEDALLGSQVITFVELIGTMLYFLLLDDNFSQSIVGMQFTALLPSVCFEFTILQLVIQNNPYAPLQNVFTVNRGYITLGCEAVVYFILFIYFQLILTSGYHPLFFFKSIKNKFTKNEEKSELDQSLELTNLTSARFYENINEKKSIRMFIKNLKKSFDEKVIINNLSLSIFSKQIFCLLGHNGAGKSTAINIITGILAPDSGVINIFGLDYYTHLQQIRNKTGVCLQTDVLYEQMTVQEHVQFYARIKGISEEMLNGKVTDLIQKCGLESEVSKKSIELSGGNKRKLCLACASIGDSQLLFLDEPSSGLDPNARKVIWSLIEELKAQGRTIILTTHHLEEAEALADRIGILAHGEMMILGSCHYIKESFGVGYYLEITVDEHKPEQKHHIRKITKELIKNVKEDDQVNDSTIKFLLPIKSQESFAQLFQVLQKQNYLFSFKLSSLEDIFIRIGTDAEHILSNEPMLELQKVELPEIHTNYNFGAQLRAVFIKKFKTTIRSFSVAISIFMPILYIIMGVVIVMVSSQGVPQYPAVVWAKYYTLAYFMSLAFSFNTAAYCGSLVLERQKKFKYLSFVMGMSKSAYWCGTICFDILMFCIPFIVLFIVIVCFPSSQSQIFVESFGWLALSLVCFAFAFLSLTYLWSFAFTSAQTAYRFYPFLVFILFYVIPSIPIYLIPTNQALIYILPIVSPLLALTNCMVSQQMLGTFNYEVLKTDGGLYIVEQIWYPLVILVLQAVLFFSLAMVLDNLKFNLIDQQQITENQFEFQKSEDLIKEKKKIDEIKEDKPILVNSLYKKYPNGFIAIRDNSFLIERGETFGLLGPNGAGKSTTFNILTAAISKTHGQVKLHGFQVNRSVAQIFTTVGVCPQFNPIYDMLTVEEHLRFFGGIKGLTGQNLNQIIDFFIKHLQLDQYRNNRSKTLSGGNKRKLCVAMALLGNPSLLFLDEPSAGVDPIARRYLWNVLHASKAAKTRSIVLTTHSINEAESLCDRIGILIKGQFYCIDSPLELKRRYGKGYRVTIKCENIQKLQKAKAQITKVFPKYQEKTFLEVEKLAFQISKEQFTFSKAFILFYNDLFTNKIILEYEIAQTTLEEVFIYLSKMQVENDVVDLGNDTMHFCCWEKNSKGCFCIC